MSSSAQTSFSFDWLWTLSRQPLFPHVTAGRLAPALILLALLMGRAAYNDVFHNKTVKRTITDPILAGAIIACPLLHPHLGREWAALALVNVICVPAVFCGWMGAQDWKVFNAFALVLGLGIVPLLEVASAAGFLWWLLPAAVALPRRLRERRQGLARARRGRIEVPMFPSICVGLLGTLALGGVPPLAVGGLALLMVAGGVYGARVVPWIEKAEREAELDEMKLELEPDIEGYLAGQISDEELQQTAAEQAKKHRPKRERGRRTMVVLALAGVVLVIVLFAVAITIAQHLGAAAGAS